MKNNIFLFFVFFLFLICSFAFLPFDLASASVSPNYAISIEVFDLGGASATSDSYQLISKMRETYRDIRTSDAYILDDRFMGMIAAIATYEPLSAPDVSAITPDKGSINRQYRVVINGANFSPFAIATLEADNMPPINGTSIIVYSTTSLECTFYLKDAPAGKRDVVVTNTDTGKSGRLSQGFEVLSSGPVKISNLHNFPNPFDPNTEVTTVEYTLSKDAALNYYLFNQKGEIVWHKTFPAGENGGRAGYNSIPWTGRSDFREGVPTGVYVLVVVARSGTRELGRVKIAVLRQ